MVQHWSDLIQQGYDFCLTIWFGSALIWFDSVPMGFDSPLKQSGSVLWFSSVLKRLVSSQRQRELIRVNWTCIDVLMYWCLWWAAISIISSWSYFSLRICYASSLYNTISLGRSLAHLNKMLLTLYCVFWFLV